MANPRKERKSSAGFWNITTILKTYGLALAVFFIFRLTLFFLQSSKVSDSTFSDIFNAFIMGVRFDIVICGYFLFFPFVFLTLNQFIFKSKIIESVTFYFILSLFSISFLISAADIPYFLQFFSRFSIGAFEWMDSPMFMLKMIVGEPTYWLYIIPYLLLLWLFYKGLKRIFQAKKTTVSSLPISIISAILFAGLMFIGVRGRIEKKSPIRVGTAFIFDNAFLNQLGLNPTFTFIRSYLDSKKDENKSINLIDEEEAIANIQSYLSIQNPSEEHPFSRVENDSATAQPKNVVLVLMESMSAHKMARHGNTKNLTPFLDSLSHEGIYFNHAYSAGIHTFNGVFSTIFSLPAIFRLHPMKGSDVPTYPGLGSAFKKHDYSTIYFTTHDGQFDNIEGFLRGNHFDQVISQSNYPAKEVKTTLGVPDAFMFEFSIPILNELHKENRPFASVFLTASDHGPYYIPDYFKPKSKNSKDQAVEFADYSLRTFIEYASKQTWYKNTLFVFVADHGAAMDADYDVSLAYNHIPILFFDPSAKTKETRTQMAGQIDIVPSILGYLGLTFENQSLGINLFQKERPYSLFNADDKYAVIDHEWLLIVKKEGDVGLYQYSKKSKKNEAASRPELVEKMNTYAKSHLQVTQYLIKRNASKKVP